MCTFMFDHDFPRILYRIEVASTEPRFRLGAGYSSRAYLTLLHYLLYRQFTYKMSFTYKILDVYYIL